MVREKRERKSPRGQPERLWRRAVDFEPRYSKTTAKVSFQSDLHPLSRRLLTHWRRNNHHALHRSSPSRLARANLPAAVRTCSQSSPWFDPERNYTAASHKWNAGMYLGFGMHHSAQCCLHTGAPPKESRLDHRCSRLRWTVRTRKWSRRSIRHTVALLSGFSS